ncbi:MAG: hypothetical protein QOD94_1562 [Alphaproteobacteria bacterium]|jgi:hypothetical protein|nr:hypothetical protein [Alphaproteobacteria bacterium]
MQEPIRIIVGYLLHRFGGFGAREELLTMPRNRRRGASCAAPGETEMTNPIAHVTRVTSGGDKV